MIMKFFASAVSFWISSVTLVVGGIIMALGVATSAVIVGAFAVGAYSGKEEGHRIMEHARLSVARSFMTGEQERHYDTAVKLDVQVSALKVELAAVNADLARVSESNQKYKHALELYSIALDKLQYACNTKKSDGVAEQVSEKASSLKSFLLEKFN